MSRLRVVRGRVTATLVLVGLMLGVTFCAAAQTRRQAHKVVLGSGETFVGYKGPRAGTLLGFKLLDGKTRWVKRKDIVRMEPVNGPSRPVPTARKTLDQVVADMLKRLRGVGKSGIVVAVTGGKVYVDLGRRDGILPGAILEVIRGIEIIKHPTTGKVLTERRDVMARLKVVSVQDQLSVCEPLDGATVQPKDEKGKHYKVMSAETKRRVRLGPVTVGGKSPPEETRIKAALLRCMSAAGFEIAARAPVMLTTKADGGENELRLRIALVSGASGAELAATEGRVKLRSSAAELGVRSALEVDLGKRLNLDVVFAAANEQCQVTRHERFLLIAKVGTVRDWAYITEEGKIIVAGRRAGRSFRAMERLAAEACFAVDLSARVDAEVDVKRKPSPFSEHCRYYFREPNVYKRLIENYHRGLREVLLDFPQCKVAAARCVFSTIGQRLWYAEAHLAIGPHAKQWDAKAERLKTIEIARVLRYGTAKMSVKAHRCGLQMSMQVLLREPSKEQFALRDRAGYYKASANAAGTLSELYLPGPPPEER